MPILDSYPDRLRSHLAAYKLSTMRVTENGLWSRNAKAYPHVLPVARKAENFISVSRELIVQYVARRGLKLHTDFHHLNSSQAMCINLMYPAVTSNSICTSLSEHLKLPARIDPKTAEFEYVPEPAEGTNFDFFARTSAGAAVYFEFKLSEVEFGKADRDARHLCKVKNIYRPRLRGLVRPEVSLMPRHILRRYQLFRNLSYLTDPNATLVLLMPQGHKKLVQQAREFLAMLNDATRERVRLAFMEDVAEVMLSAVATGHAHLHLQEFQAKYCFGPASATDADSSRVASGPALPSRRE